MNNRDLPLYARVGRATSVAIAVAALCHDALAQPSIWQKRPSGTTNILFGAAYGPFASYGPLFFVVGANGIVDLSLDGANWSPSTVGTTSYYDVETNGAGCFMASGNTGRVDAFGPCSGLSVGANVLWSGVAWGGGSNWSVVGGLFTSSWFDVTIGTTNNGASWLSPVVKNSSQLNTPYDVAGNGLVYFAAWGSGWIKRSTDGVNFSDWFFTGSSVQQIAYGNGIWVSVGYNGRVCWSSNQGASWNCTNIAGAGTLSAVGYGGGYFVAGGNDGEVYYSTNGQSWTRATSPSLPGVGLDGVAYGNGTWIIVGGDGTILQSSINADLVSYRPSGWPSDLNLTSTPGIGGNTTLFDDSPVYVQAAWQNVGRGSAAPFQIGVTIDGSFIGVVPALGIGPGSNSAFTNVQITGLTAGTHQIELDLDHSGVVAEADEANNKFGKSFTVIVRPCPCPADFDGSGGTPDAGDIDAFFASWLSGLESADTDCSGGTPDASDVDEFFRSWLAGGC